MLTLTSFRDAGCEAERLLAKYGLSQEIAIPAVLTSGIIDDLAERERRESQGPASPELHKLLDAYTSTPPITGPGITRLHALLTAIVDRLEEKAGKAGKEAKA